jgi:phosphohistidine swiveling domain-containing protein
MRAFSTELKTFGQGKEISLQIYERGQVAAIYDENRLRVLGKIFLEKFLAEPALLEMIKTNFNRKEREIERFFSIISEEEIAALDEKKLTDYYLEFLENYVGLFEWATSAEQMGLYLQDFLGEKALEAARGDRELAQKYFVALTTPTKPSFLKQQELELQKIINEGRNYDELLEQHARRWCWMRNTYGKGIVLEKKFFEEEAKRLKEAGGLRMVTEEEAAVAKKGVLEEMSASKELRRAVEIAEYYMELHDRRKGAVMRGIYCFEFFFKEFGKRMKLSEREVKALVPEEVTAFFQNKQLPDKKMLAERIKLCVGIWENGTRRLVVGKEAEEWKERIYGSVDENQRILRGICGSPGIATGRVRILGSAKEIDKIQEGEILIATITTPEYVPAMRKARAIVTEKGGITCHAAIVARELGIPCVVGVDSVTRILKEGESVEVDATAGVVRRL